MTDQLAACRWLATPCYTAGMPRPAAKRAAGPRTGTRPPRAAAPLDPDFSLDRYLFNVLSQLEQAYRTQVHTALRPHKVSLPVWRTLGVLREHDGCTVTELAARTVTERTALTRVLQQMEKRGLIRREVRSDDRRAQGVFMTAAGRALLAQILPVVERVYRRVTLGAEPAALASLVADLTKLRGNAG